jgi:hypothetical protein
MTKISGMPAPCNTASITEHNALNAFLSVSPNPSNGNFMAEYISDRSENVRIRLYDVAGRIAYEHTMSLDKGNNLVNMELHDLDSGIYLLEFATQHGKQNVKLVIED